MRIGQACKEVGRNILQPEMGQASVLSSLSRDAIVEKSDNAGSDQA